MLDYAANQPTAVALPELLPLRFRDMELLAGLLAVQCALELGHDRILDQGSPALPPALIPQYAVALKKSNFRLDSPLRRFYNGNRWICS